MLVRPLCSGDWLTLCPWKGCSSWSRPAVGESLFGFLPPGRYLLGLDRNCRCVCRLRLTLPPGANVTLWLDPAERTWSWRREFFHCLYNQRK
ncbi:MAG: hypothetical protein MSB10_10795 [Clostridiales bacterium]|uniref:hypothetical protein n=1 Tax=Flavonifractor porci TaxID=3133422 RepID=UPI0030A8CBCF|nr:hypothetical protein [Clostridiales bacterium]